MPKICIENLDSDNSDSEEEKIVSNSWSLYHLAITLLKNN